MDVNKDNVFSVSEINLHIKHILENNIPQLLVEGEIANFTRHRSGHIYFSLKDENSSIRCVFFRSYVQKLIFDPKEGDKVICKGRITVFERAGNYQLNVTDMLPAGVGELQLKFEKLKAKLKSEGLFDINKKKKKEKKKKLPHNIEAIESKFMFRPFYTTQFTKLSISPRAFENANNIIYKPNVFGSIGFETSIKKIKFAYAFKLNPLNKSFGKTDYKNINIGIQTRIVGLKFSFLKYFWAGIIMPALLKIYA